MMFQTIILNIILLSWRKGVQVQCFGFDSNQLRTVVAGLKESEYSSQKSLMSDEKEQKIPDQARAPPVIGILSTPSVGSTKGKRNKNDGMVRQGQESGDDDEVYYYVAASYVKWLEASGARSVALPFYSDNPEELKHIFSQINGILFPGGEDFRDMPNSTAPLFYNFALEANDRGDYFPIWGTCLGFEYLVMLGASGGGEDGSTYTLDPQNDTPLQGINTSVLDSGYDAWNMTLSLNYTRAANHSRMYGSDTSIRNNAGSLPITMNNHHNGIEPQHFMEHAELSKMYKVLSTNVDRQGRPFVSSIEAREYPFLGVQYHPEKNQFEYRTYPNSTLPYEVVNHSPEGVALSRHMSELFVNEARKNKHTFVDAESYPPLYTFEHRIDVGGFQQIYVVEYASERQHDASRPVDNDTSKKIKPLSFALIAVLVTVGLVVGITTIWAMLRFCSTCPYFSSSSSQNDSDVTGAGDNINVVTTTEEAKLDEPLLPNRESGNIDERKYARENVKEGQKKPVTAQILSV